eukprot:354154-Chlamydomonas_euryale.AAC.1
MICSDAAAVVFAALPYNGDRGWGRANVLNRSTGKLPCYGGEQVALQAAAPFAMKVSLPAALRKLAWAPRQARPGLTCAWLVYRPCGCCVPPPCCAGGGGTRRRHKRGWRLGGRVCIDFCRAATAAGAPQRAAFPRSLPPIYMYPLGRQPCLYSTTLDFPVQVHAVDLYQLCTAKLLVPPAEMIEHGQCNAITTVGIIAGEE